MNASEAINTSHDSFESAPNKEKEEQKENKTNWRESGFNIYVIGFFCGILFTVLCSYFWWYATIAYAQMHLVYETSAVGMGAYQQNYSSYLGVNGNLIIDPDLSGKKIIAIIPMKSGFFIWQNVFYCAFLENHEIIYIGKSKDFF